MSEVLWQKVWRSVCFWRPFLLSALLWKRWIIRVKLWISLFFVVSRFLFGDCLTWNLGKIHILTNILQMRYKKQQLVFVWFAWWSLRAMRVSLSTHQRTYLLPEESLVASALFDLHFVFAASLLAMAHATANSAGATGANEPLTFRFRRALAWSSAWRMATLRLPDSAGEWTNPWKETHLEDAGATAWAFAFENHLAALAAGIPRGNGAGQVADLGMLAALHLLKAHSGHFGHGAVWATGPICDLRRPIRWSLRALRVSLSTHQGAYLLREESLGFG